MADFGIRVIKLFSKSKEILNKYGVEYPFFDKIISKSFYLLRSSLFLAKPFRLILLNGSLNFFLILIKIYRFNSTIDYVNLFLEFYCSEILMSHFLF